ncbi:GntR family transcriptional regulator [Bacillus sp. B15-48]|uniref:GntR family transcriptional regulator n=1 Tax=Bacillus sp. B15-48 TaxID=1548601 RepID=UPI00193FD674|nr:GntR family transcriptional regulator [Bacillus sp. B15-48]MBM4764702.1 FCD domain-containing protein [Bacillus sp. B15-48]
MDPYTFIKDAIITGKYEPGERLTEEFLAKESNVSRTPIREAIKQLEYEGLITPLKRGITVRSFSKEDIHQIYGLRALLESYAGSQAAQNRDDDDLNNMMDANAKYTEVINRNLQNRDMKSIYDIVKVNSVFHETVLAASKNEHLRFHLSKVVVIPLVFRSFYWYDENQLKHSLEAHQIIVRAIQNQDTERAKIAMQEHIYKGRDHVLKHYDKLKRKFRKGNEDD